MELDEFLKLDKPTEYNFEFENVECDLDTYSKLAVYSRYFTYKASRLEHKENVYEKGRQFVVDTVEKYRCIADPDGSLERNHTCMLSRELYRKLWGWEDSPKGKLDRYGVVMFDEFGRLEFGPDTMNSAQTTLNRAVEICEDEKIKELKKGNISINFMLELYSNEYKEDLMRWLDDVEGLQDFLNLYHTLGNFVLVPAYFNGYRASKVNGNDYWDKSLTLLQSKNEVWMSSNNKEILWNKNLYTRYVNYFFLWDYTEEYNPKIISNIQYKADMEKFLETTCRNIRRRGDFMVAMLKIQKINPEYYSQLIKNIFNTENLYQNYEEVMEAIKTQSCYSNENVKNIIDALVLSLCDKSC
jgi:hypothetical protein